MIRKRAHRGHRIGAAGRPRARWSHRRVREAIILGGLVVAVTPATPASGAGLREIPSGTTLVSVGQRVRAVDAYTAATGLDPAATMWYQGLYGEPADVQAGLDKVAADAQRRPNSAVNLAISFGAISTPQVSRAPLVPAGALDAQIDVLATWLKQLDRAVFLRIGYEFDLAGGQYGPAPVYVAAYRHVVDRLRAAGVDNVAYVWHSAGVVFPTDGPLPIRDFYPGREYVDYFGISYWGDFCCGGPGNAESFADYDRRTRGFLDQAKALGLPIQFGEATPAYVGADSKAESVAWLERYFRLTEEYDIRALNLITQDWPNESDFFGAPFWNGFWPDSRIQQFPETRERFMAEVSKSRYVNGCPQLNAWLRGRAPRPCAVAAPKAKVGLARITVGKAGLRMRRGVVRVRVTCRKATSGCRGTLYVERRRGRGRRLGKSTIKLAPGTGKTLNVRINARGRRAIARDRGWLRITLRRTGVPKRKTVTRRLVRVR